MLTISKDSPCLSITTVALNRLSVFRTERLKAIACAALDEARRFGGFALFAYVIMPDHIHAITDGTLKPSDTLRFVNGILSHRVIEYLKVNGHAVSLAKLRTQEKGRRYRYSLVDHHSNIMLLTSESFFMQRVNYIHQNPVRAGLVARAEDYRWSSVRCRWGGALHDEPLLVDLSQISWKKPRREREKA
jgi:REP element-mobilizing transposase RayT